MKPRDYALRELDQKRLPHWPAGSFKRLRPAPPPTDLNIASFRGTR